VAPEASTRDVVGNSHQHADAQHGSSIEVYTQPGEFTEIRVILPRTAVFV